MNIKINTSWNLFGSIIPLLIGLLSMPILLTNIGVEKLGILTIIWALVGYFSVFDLGLGRALTQRISSLLILEDYKSISSNIKTGILIISLAGLLGAMLLYTLLMSGGADWLNFSEAVYDDARSSLLISVFIIPLTTMTIGLKGVLEGFEDFKSSNILRLIMGILNFGTPVLSVSMFGDKLEYIVMFLAVSRLLVLVLHVQAVLKHDSRWLVASIVSRDESTDLMRFGAWMTLSNILGPLMAVADRFVISALLGASVVAYYTVPAEFLMRALIIPGALTATLFPIFAKLKSGDVKRLYEIYISSFRVIGIVMGLIMFFVAAFSYYGLSFWLGADFADNAYLVVIMLSIGVFFNSLAQIPHAHLQGVGDVRVTALIHVAEACFYIPVLILITPVYGLVGVACLWSSRTFVDLVALLYFSRQRLLHA